MRAVSWRTTSLLAGQPSCCRIFGATFDWQMFYQTPVRALNEFKGNLVFVVQSLSHICRPRGLQHAIFTIAWSWLKLTSIKSVMPSNHLILCHPLLLPSIFPSIRVFSNESALLIRWPEYWSFNFSISPANEYSGLISFRIDWFDLLLSKGFSRDFSSTTVQKHQFFSAQLSAYFV